MTVKQRERDEALERLREWVKPGDNIYCVLRHVSQSGMMRVIDVKVIRDNEMLHIGYNVAQVLDYPFDKKREGMRVKGVGMDMGFHVVYRLSNALFGDGYILHSRWV